MSDFEWAAAYKLGAEACREGKPYDRDQSEAWQRGFGDAVAIDVADELP